MLVVVIHEKRYIHCNSKYYYILSPCFTDDSWTSQMFPKTYIPLVNNRLNFAQLTLILDANLLANVTNVTTKQLDRMNVDAILPCAVSKTLKSIANSK